MAVESGNREGPSSETPPRASRIWWWIVIAFLVQIAVWTAWLVFASKNPVQEIPVVTSGR